MELKFRAWAKYTINLRYEYAHKKVNEKFTDHFDNYKWDEYDNFDDWYDAQGECFSTSVKEYVWEETFVEYKMIYDDFSIWANWDIRQTSWYEILEIMQYTWLKDSKGEEIYSGDILRSYHKTWEVIERMGSFWIMINPQDFLSLYDIWDRWDWHKAEIVWNIHQNKELLNNK